METIKVNMTPCDDVQTIHASQNDNEAREWGFELHNNGEKIDSSSITDQLVFKAYEGGTEEILPTNGSVPTTAPFLGDIRYPQGLLTDQEFTYRQSPTEEDGLAKITDIKGQTLKWNQFCCKGRYFTRGSNEWQNTYTDSGVTFTYLDDYTVRITGTPTARAYIYLNRLDNANYPVKQGEKLLLRCSDAPNGIDIISSFYLDNTWKGAGPQKSNKYVTVPSDVNKLVCMGIDVQASLVGQTIDVTVSLNVFNLTKMFGSGNEPTEEEFNALFPFYYPYNSGSLIPFNGNGIKTTGKNLFQNNAVNRTQLGITFTINDDKSITVNGTATGVAYITRAEGLSAPNIKKGESLIFGGSLNLPQSKAYFQLVYKGASTGTTYSFVSTNASSVSINATEDMTLDGIYFNIQNGATVNNMTAYPMLRYAGTDPIYEPYTESTLSLPISTYFPSGMKSAGSVYDELTNYKAITRVGSRAYQSGDESDTSVITDGTTTYYALATPTETSFTTASLVTENAEIPLSNEDDTLIGKCTEQLSENPGFIDAKIKLSDSDGECYSNKLQLHVERSPQ